DAGDEVGQRLAAVQLVRIRAATQRQVAAAFGVNTSTVYRWSCQLADEGAAGLVAERRGPQGPSKLSGPVVAEIESLREQGYSMRTIATCVGVAHSSIARALSQTSETEGPGIEQVSGADDGSNHDETAGTDDDDVDDHDGADAVPLLAAPLDRSGERALARFGLLDEAAPVFTPAARVPLSGMLLAVPALACGGLLDSARQVYGSLPAGFYVLETTLMEAVFRTLAGEP